MNKKKIITFIFAFALITFGSFNLVSNAQNAPQNTKTQTTNTQIINTTSLAIVANPNKFLNKTIKMQATFDKFSTLGLDYKKAMRSSEEYIGILIQRDDTLDRNIPLSEMKLFMPKKMAEKFIDLDAGDKIQITAHVFSTALNDPWLDIKNIQIIKKTQLSTKNNQSF